MIGRLVSFWDCLSLGAMLNFRGVLGLAWDLLVKKQSYSPKPRGTILDLLLLGAWEMKRLDIPLRQMLVGWQNLVSDHNLNLMGSNPTKKNTKKFRKFKKFQRNPPNPYSNLLPFCTAPWLVFGNRIWQKTEIPSTLHQVKV